MRSYDRWRTSSKTLQGGSDTWLLAPSERLRGQCWGPTACGVRSSSLASTGPTSVVTTWTRSLGTSRRRWCSGCCSRGSLQTRVRGRRGVQTSDRGRLNSETARCTSVWIRPQAKRANFPNSREWTTSGFCGALTAGVSSRLPRREAIRCPRSGLLRGPLSKTSSRSCSPGSSLTSAASSGTRRSEWVANSRKEASQSLSRKSSAGTLLRAASCGKASCGSSTRGKSPPSAALSAS
mmetsp:Transcript_60971/g.143848  ORF Transcript_60971/g.143848 Transcript_60971/m.143848 type:complete len:236 (-) Transcript_60971:730-1437(-)